MECPQVSWTDTTDILHGIMAPQEESYMHPGLTHGHQAGLSLDSTLDLEFGLAESHAQTAAPEWSSVFAPSAGSPDFCHPYYHPSRLTASQDAWSPLQVTGVPSQSTMSHMQMPKVDHEAGFVRDHYRTPSETGSQHLGSLHSGDSGYGGTSCGTGSVVPSSYGVDSISSPLAGFNEQSFGDSISMFNRAFVGSTTCSEDFPSSLVESVKCDHPTCTWVGKCPSDKRKHEARHRKLFKCDEPNCPRKEGFGTINDLARHKKCVHNKEPERGPKMMYLCFGQNCPRPNKMWPRQDNFKQHLSRMHHGEDADALLKKSMDWYESSGRSLQSNEDTVSEDAFSEAQQDLVYNHSANMNAPSSTNSPKETGESCLPGLPTPRPLHYHSTQIQPENSHPEPFPSLAVDDHPINAEPEPARSGTSISDAADNLINAMTKMMNARGRRSSQHSDEGIEIETEGTDLPQPKRQMLQKILATALERLSEKPGVAPTMVESNEDKHDWFQCDVCPKRTRLRCEMKKHQKRHERPYGCTFPQCAKSFGSKADWKRHETSQHLNIPSWLCTLHDPVKNGVCERIFYREELFTQHLNQAHTLPKTRVVPAVQASRLDVAHQSQYWCGFCTQYLPLSSSGAMALDERFNHIDVEHFKKGVKGKQWCFPSTSIAGNTDAVVGSVFASENVTLHGLERVSRKRKLGTRQ
ncbi:hypothetical protein PDE_00938 [Penicillium oxalicum 114-2]|uniref:C2H2-type domain-containing protein n=1 Tax=Penicillium oxalicum (strain 114-2 / CGMCC 5302) TaxID=933388 RepID=S8AVU8_PENO1|nr:hypothetical protein PDE_00938 [Penicillium oxalicum 114-2]